MRGRLIAAIAVGALAATSCVPDTRPARTRRGPADRVIADFEDGSGPFVGGGEKTVLDCVARPENPLGGRRSLKVVLPPGPYPGISMDVLKGDWRAYSALAFDCHNPSGKPVKLSVRIDDRLSMSWATRLNLENWITLGPGRTGCVLPLSGAELGSVGARGLDVSNIRSLHLFFLGVKEPTTLYIDDVRLVGRRPPEAGARASIIPAEMAANEGAKVSRAPDGSVTCVVSGGKYPGVKFDSAVKSWLGHDWLEIETDSTASRGLVVKFSDATGRSSQCVTRIGKGRTLTRMPVHLVGHLDLTRAGEVVLFTRPKPAGILVFRRIELVAAPPMMMKTVLMVPKPLQEGTLFELDGTRLARVGRNSGLAFFVYPPGTRPTVRTPKGKGDLRHVVPLDGMLFLGAVKSMPVCGYFFDHGMRHFASSELELKPGERSVWRPGIEDFGH